MRRGQPPTSEDLFVTDFLYRTLLIGIGATALFDLWGLLLSRVFGLPGANWGIVGRWFCHLAYGKVFHVDIAKAPAVPDRGHGPRHAGAPDEGSGRGGRSRGVHA
jgi:hypothetical protein